MDQPNRSVVGVSQESALAVVKTFATGIGVDSSKSGDLEGEACVRHVVGYGFEKAWCEVCLI